MVQKVLRLFALFEVGDALILSGEHIQDRI
jgi:hypothetical protein